MSYALNAKYFVEVNMYSRKTAVLTPSILNMLRLGSGLYICTYILYTHITQYTYSRGASTRALTSGVKVMSMAEVQKNVENM